MKNIPILFLILLMTTTMANAQDGKATTLKKAFSRQTSVTIKINAAPEVIWNLLTDAEAIPRWNSTILQLEGTIAKGEKIKLKSTVDESRTFKLKVKKLEPYSKMVWASGAAPFFRGVRTYTLSNNNDGTTGFSMTEKIAGLMFPMAAKSIPPFDASFEQFAADLKKAAENSN